MAKNKDERTAGELEHGDKITLDDRIYILSYAKYERQTETCFLHLIDANLGRDFDVTCRLDKVFKLA